MAVDAVLIPVVFVPLVLAPLACIRHYLLRILDLRSVCLAELLTKLKGSCRTVLDTLTAGYTLCLVHVGPVSACGHVGSIEQLAGSEGVTDFDVAVADCKNLVLAVDVRNLVDKAVVLGTL